MVSATASDPDGTVSKVDFYAGASLIGTSTTAPYSITWSNAASGKYSLTAKATDNDGNTATSPAVNITVDVLPTVSIYFIHTDHLNTPRLITNSAEQAVWRWETDEPFGANAPNENPSGLGNFTCNLRFPGQYFDKETNLHYNGARDYDSGIGRFIQPEPLGLAGDINLYRYARDNPLTFFDPDGRQSREIRNRPSERN